MLSVMWAMLKRIPTWSTFAYGSSGGDFEGRHSFPTAYNIAYGGTAA